MMNGPSITTRLPGGALSNLGVPLLDDEFDPAVEEILDHSEMYSSYVRHHEVDEFSL